MIPRLQVIRPLLHTSTRWSPFYSSVFLMAPCSCIHLNTPTQLSLAFDAAYCYMLQNIQEVWRTNDGRVRGILILNINIIMRRVLTPLAEILVQQPWEDGVAAPCFNYYAMTGSVGTVLVPSLVPLTPGALYTQLKYRVQDALAAAKAENAAAAGDAVANAANVNAAAASSSTGRGPRDWHG